MNGFFVALFQKKAHAIGAPSHSCVEFQFSPPPAERKQGPISHSQGKGKGKKRKQESDEKWGEEWTGGGGDYSKKSRADVGSGEKASSTGAGAGGGGSMEVRPAKKAREGRMLTLWKPKKRR